MLLRLGGDPTGHGQRGCLEPCNPQVQTESIMQTKFIEAGAALDLAIKQIKVKGKALDALIQQAAMSAARVVQDTGNIMYVNSLYLAMPKGARHVALTTWLTEFAGVSANEGESKDIKPFSFDKNKTVDLAGGEACPWFDMKASPKPDEVLDLLKLTLSIIKRASSPKEGQEIAHGEMLVELQALAERFASVDEVADASEEV